MDDSSGEGTAPPRQPSLSRDAAELHVFQAALGQRRPRVTIALMMVISGVFALQALWGGIDLPPLLARMGSLIPDRARNGEWWRFLSCTFLHGGALHVSLNLLVLWMIGRFLERVVGPARFALLYLSAGLAGSVSSSFFVTSQSVGASGAIWGLLGAEVALVFYPRPLIPRVLLPAARRVALVNLALNLLNSLNPHVDVAAHLGGGLMGALTFIAIAALGPPQLERRRGGGLAGARVAAIALACVFGSGLAVAQLRGRPWELTGHTDLVQVALGASGWTARIPQGLAPIDGMVAGRASRFGNLAYDPCAVDVTWTDLPRGLGAQAPTTEGELALIRRQLTTPPAGLEEIRPPDVIHEGARGWVGARYRYTSNPEVINDRAIGLKEGRLIRVDVMAWEALPHSYEGLASAVLQSISPVVTRDTPP